MARQCYFCDKKPRSVNKISHSNIKTKSRKLPNLHSVKHATSKGTQTVYACTRCIRSNRVVKPLRRNVTAAPVASRAS